MKRWLLWMLAGVMVVIVAGGVGLAWRLNGRGPSRPSVDDAINRFRTPTTTPSDPARLQPPAGVYVYEGSGSESLSFLATKQPQGPTMPGTVTPEANGCWTFRIDYNSYHHQTWRRCAKGSTLVETGGTAVQEFDFVAFTQTEHSSVTCAPPFTVLDTTAEPGATWPVTCRTSSETTKTDAEQTGTMTFVGPETLTIGTERIPAMHVRQDLVMRADQHGAIHIDNWFATADGLPLREKHDIEVVSPAPAPINEVTYREVGEWTLTSLEPKS
jgi:hypothetical protein